MVIDDVDIVETANLIGQRDKYNELTQQITRIATDYSQGKLTEYAAAEALLTNIAQLPQDVKIAIFAFIINSVNGLHVEKQTEIDAKKLDITQSATKVVVDNIAVTKE